jgi:hypothetical protein
MEVETMAERKGLTYEQELMRDFFAEGELRSHRRILRGLLEDRFGALPAELLTRIESANLEMLEKAIRQVTRPNSPDELQL